MNKRIFLRVLGYIKKYWIFFALSICCAAVSVIFTLMVPVFIGDAVDFIADKGEVDFLYVFAALKKIAAVVLLAAFAQWIMNISNNKMTYGIVRDIRNEAFEKIELLPLQYIDGHSYGGVVSRVTQDAEQFSEGLLMGFTQFFTGVLTILGTLILMFSKNILITAVVVVVTPLSFLAAAFIAKRTYSMFRLQAEARGHQTVLIEEMIGNQKVVQAFQYEKEALERFDAINEQLGKHSLSAIFISSISNPVTRFINALVYALVALTGAYSVLKGTISIGGLTCLLSYANQYSKPFNEISGVVSELQNALACAGRMFELIDEEEELADGADAIELKDVKGEISIEHVYFSYDPKVKLIEDFNLEVGQGVRVAIVGPTGCGKTTLINLLMRFYETDRGSIRIDGEDIARITRKSLRTSYGMVLQDTWLAAGTIRENIAMGKPDASFEEIKKAAEASYAHSFIKRLPEGYDTLIKEDAEGLSQGEKQLLCIARVMLLLPPMLILDEATSSIDTRTEQKIQKAFARMMEGRTSFVVAHRLSTIQEADVILVMDKGHIIEQGLHEELLKKGGFYAKLYNSQFTH